MVDLSTIAARKNLAGKYATKYSLDVALLCALIEQESSWNTWSTRYELGFYATYVQPLVNTGKVSNMTEAMHRATSFGLCQVMGQVARELGFTGRYLPELCDPDVGVDYGAEKLSQCIKKTDTIEKALLRYNGGGDANYPFMVLNRKSKYEGDV